MQPLTSTKMSEELRGAKPVVAPDPPRGPDWRGWMAVAWVVFWGAAYSLMVIQARAPRILQWLGNLAERLHSS